MDLKISLDNFQTDHVDENLEDGFTMAETKKATTTVEITITTGRRTNTIKTNKFWKNS